MTGSNTISRNLIHYTFITICIAGFLMSCLGFLVYRLLLKPFIFGMILLLTLPLIGRELLKETQPPHSSRHHSHP
jgi:hypothetical protein